MQQPCAHPAKRIRYHVADDLRPDSPSEEFTLVPTLYGMCCDCGAVVAEKALAKVLARKAGTRKETDKRRSAGSIT